MLTSTKPLACYCFERWVNFNDVIHKMSQSMALNLKEFLLKMSLSCRGIHIILITIATKNDTQPICLPQLSWQSTSASEIQQSGRNLQQKLWRLNWTNLYDLLWQIKESTTSSPLCLLFSNSSNHRETYHQSCDFSCTVAQHLYAWILNLGKSAIFWVNLAGF